MDVSTDRMEAGNGNDPLRYLSVLTNGLSTPALLWCPADKDRQPAATFSSLRRESISYFVGLDAKMGQPQDFLAGDRNLITNGSPVGLGLAVLTTNMVLGWTAQIHNLQGNIALGDGSVQQFNGPKLTQAMRGLGVSVARLAVP